VLLWRISNHADLSGRGGLLADGRWNKLGTPLVYRSDHPATALLEVLAHIDRSDVPESFRLLTIELPDTSPTIRLDPKELPSGGRSDLAITQNIATELLSRAEHLLILVPCVLVPDAWNALLNPLHPHAALCSIIDSIESFFDPRLIR
jgi:RES domain-containing protein